MPQLQPLNLVAPGSLGLNKEQEFSLLDQRWATDALNCVLDRSGRLAARKGWANQTSNAVAGNENIVQLHERITEAAAVQMIVATPTKIFKDIDDFTDVANDITSTTAPTAGHWKFMNFNNFVLGWQRSHAPIQWTGTGDFTDIVASSGTIPAGHAATAAFGRIWAVDSDLQTIKYCALLDHLDWGGSDTGSINMRSVWTKGTDEVVAIVGWGSNLIVFGRKHIVMWADGSGSTIGIDPLQIEVFDIIEGTGSIARDSIQEVGDDGDLIFLSAHGVQSLRRVIEERSNPLAALTKNVRTLVTSYIQSEANFDAIKSVYSEQDGLYLLTFPDNATSLYVDTRRFFTDDEGDLVARITNWQHSITPLSFASRRNGDFLLGFNGVVGLYGNNLDNTERYDCEYSSGWLNPAPEVENVLKILKQIDTRVLLGAANTVAWNWAFDFQDGNFTASSVYTQSGQAEFNVAEYNIGEYSGGVSIQTKTIDGKGEGQYIRVGLNLQIDNADFVLQQITLFLKLGRMT